MSRLNLVILQILLIIGLCNCKHNAKTRILKKSVHGNAGEPLLLTPLIKAGNAKHAKELALVPSEQMKGLRSYAGYFTVNEVFNSNMFFWFFPSQNDYDKDPVILWLQGGPGDSSLLGLFLENGPFIAQEHGIETRQYSWTQNHSVIYIDNPVGTGYSFTNDGGYSQNETAIGDNLYSALLQFFKLFPEIQKNDFYVAGESYAGKYVPAISYTIHRNNPHAKSKINLKGLSIESGLCDPVHQMDIADYLYQIGLVDSNLRAQLRALEQKGIKYIHNQRWLDALEVFENDYTSLVVNATGFSYFFYYLSPTDDLEAQETNIANFVATNQIRAAIHVGNTSFVTESSTVPFNLANDYMQSVAPWISELLNHYRVLFYNGQLDIILAYPLTVNFLRHMNFSAAAEYKTAPRHQWYVDNELAGYVKQAGNLTEVLVRNAGHFVPTYQPHWVYDLITKFTRNEKLYQ